MKQILPNAIRRPLYRRARAKHVEQSALQTVAPYTLMQRAGTAIAKLARALRPHANTVWVAVGPGNNGGDGLEAATQLKMAGLQVFACLTGDADLLPDDARQALARARAAGVDISNNWPTEPAPDLAIDALLGLGANRAPAEALANVMRQLGALGCPILSIDIPSGLNADTGQPFAQDCIKATWTLTLLTIKPGLFTGAGRDHAGDVWFDDLEIDAPQELADAWLLESTAGSSAFHRAHANHKGSFGDLAVVGGASGMTGAAHLAARAAHAAGAGRVFVSMPDTAHTLFDPLRPELMFRAAWWHSEPATLRRSTVVCGCGAGLGIKDVLPVLLSQVPRLVLDADALTAIAADTSLQRLLQARHSRSFETVLTPHPLEAARLLQASTVDVQDDRIAAAEKLAVQFECVVVLKGSGTVISMPGDLSFVNPTGNAALATAGTGDVLAGWLGGVWSAQRTTAREAALQTVWLHGHAADVQPNAPLRAADLIEVMHRHSGGID